jgi:hypothetical protein
MARDILPVVVVVALVALVLVHLHIALAYRAMVDGV